MGFKRWCRRNKTTNRTTSKIMGRKIPIMLTFVYILLSAVYGLIEVDDSNLNLAHSLWWGVHGVIIMCVFIITAREVFSRVLKISLRIIGVFILLQSLISIIDIYTVIDGKSYSLIVLLYFLTSLIYWKYDRRRKP